ncbi:dockerin type I domain-containing protein [Planctomycetota bacterium]
MTKLKQAKGIKWGMLLVLVLVLGLGLQAWSLESKGFVAPTGESMGSLTTTSEGPDQVTSPDPVDGATGVPITQQLGWAPANGATSYDVFFGTSADPRPAYQTNTTDTSYSPGTLSYNTIYYWLIDSKDEAGTTFGNLWSFRTEAEPVTPPAQVTLRDPSDGATGVFITQQLRWASASGATSYDVYFGTSNPPSYQSNTTDTSYTPALSYSTTYYWRIDSKNSVGTTTGNLWSFQTRGENDPYVGFTVGEVSSPPGRNVIISSRGEVVNRPDLDTLTGFSMWLGWGSSVELNDRDPIYNLYDTIWEANGEITRWEVDNGYLVIEVRHPGVPMDPDGGMRSFLNLAFSIKPDAEPGTVNLSASNVVFYGPEGESITLDSITSGAITVEYYELPSPNLLSIKEYKAFPGESLNLTLEGTHLDTLTGYTTEIHFDPTLFQIDPASLSVAGTPWENGDIVVSEVDNQLGVIQFEVHQPGGVVPVNLNKPRPFLSFTAEVNPAVAPGTVIDLTIMNAFYYGDNIGELGEDPGILIPDTGHGKIIVTDVHAIFEFGGEWVNGIKREFVSVEETTSFWLYGRWNVEILSYEGSFAEFPGITAIDLEGTVAEGGTLEKTLSDGIWSFNVTPLDPIPATSQYLDPMPILRITVLFPVEFEGMDLPLDLRIGWVTWNEGAGSERTIADIIDGVLSIYYRHGSMTLSAVSCQPGDTATITLSGEWFMRMVKAFSAGILFPAEFMQVVSVHFPPELSDNFGLSTWSNYSNEPGCEFGPFPGKGNVMLGGSAIGPEDGIPGPGSGDLAYIDFEVPITATLGVYDISFMGMFGIFFADYVDERGIAHSPELFSGSIEITEQSQGIPGDVNGDGVLDISDLTYLVDYMFGGGPEPIGDADMQNDGAWDISDLTYFVDYMFGGGPAPE